MNHKLLREALDHFNEPVLVLGRGIGRLVGYAEDDDCYLIIQYPGPLDEKLNPTGPITIWHSMVGGYFWLDPFKGERWVRGASLNHMDDFSRLNHYLEINGVSVVKEFIVKGMNSND